MEIENTHTPNPIHLCLPTSRFNLPTQDRTESQPVLGYGFHNRYDEVPNRDYEIFEFRVERVLFEIIV